MPDDIERGPEDLLAALQEGASALRGFAAGESAAPVAAFLRLQEARVARLDDRRQRLVEERGEDAPQVRAVTRRVTAATAVREEAAQLAQRAAKAHRVMPHEIGVAGQVLGADGRPLAGVRVRLYDRDVKDDDLLADVRTDLAGGYAAVFHARDFAEAGEGSPEIHVVIDDARGVTLADTSSRVAVGSGVTSALRIVLSQVTADDLAPGEQGMSFERCAATTANGAPCRNQARSGEMFCGVHAQRGRD